MLAFSRTFSSVVHPNDIIVLAVSGGVDSMVLLDLVRKFHPTENIVVAHFDHSLRGAESDGDRDFVADFCKKENIAFKSKKEDIATLANSRKGSLEAVAREERYKFLEHVRCEQGAKYILTAHHADDQVETILQNLLKGGKLQGLSGMSIVSTSSLRKELSRSDGGLVRKTPETPIPPSAKADTPALHYLTPLGSLSQGGVGTIFRPLLEQTKAEILHYAESCDITYREDSTNADIVFERNKIRHQVLPVLLELNPSAHRTFSNLAKYMQEIVSFFDAECSEWFIEAARVSGKPHSFLIEDFTREHPFFQRELIAELYRHAHGASSQGLSSRLITELIRFISDKNSFGKKDIGNLHLERRGERIIIKNGE